MTIDTARTVRIGGASAFWGDTAEAPAQLVAKGNVDYLIFDFLAEVTMSLLAKAREKSPRAGYATDFVQMLTPLLPQIAEQNIRVVANAGGVNLDACRMALEAACKTRGVTLSIGTVEGDNLLDQVDFIRDEDIIELDTGAELPGKILSMNAYLGAFPIAAALDAGADIVITGRCVDSALVLGPLIHEFGWLSTYYDRLAQGSLCGHLLECGTQVTGGNFTDWQDVADGWDNMGYPVATVSADGSFEITKPDDTGGLISPLSVGEQMLYEIGDPGSYILPDVTCDFRRVTLTQAGKDCVRVEGAKGRMPSDDFKVSATYLDGFKSTPSMLIAGVDAVKKAKATETALLKRARRMFKEKCYGDFDRVTSEFVGNEGFFGAQSRVDDAGVREVVLRLNLHHPEKAALDLFAREFMGTYLSMTTGRSGLEAGRPKVTPLIRLFSFYYDKENVDAIVSLNGEDIGYAEVASLTASESVPPQLPLPDDMPENGEHVEVPLIRLAVARSGDKGDSANIGIIARKPEYLPAIRASLTAEQVKGYFAHYSEGKVERFDLPGIDGLNFLMHRVLGGGGMAAMRIDTQGKTYAQLLLDIPVSVPASWGLN
jgi:hypothetical protein